MHCVKPHCLFSASCILSSSHAFSFIFVVIIQNTWNCFIQSQTIGLSRCTVYCNGQEHSWILGISLSHCLASDPIFKNNNNYYWRIRPGAFCFQSPCCITQLFLIGIPPSHCTSELSTSSSICKPFKSSLTCSLKIKTPDIFSVSLLFCW